MHTAQCSPVTADDNSQATSDEAYAGDAQALPGGSPAPAQDGETQALPGQGTVVRDAETNALPGQVPIVEVAFSDASSQVSDGGVEQQMDAIDTLTTEMQLTAVQEEGDWELCLRNKNTGECFPVADPGSAGWQRYSDPDTDRYYWYSVEQSSRSRRWFYHPT